MLKEINVQLPEELVSSLESLAAAQGISLSDVLKQYLQDLLDKQKVGGRRSYRVGEFDPHNFKLTPEERIAHHNAIAETRQFIENLGQQYSHIGTVDAVEMIREGRREL
jgi:Arc/MetJ-type ribon-helix-helix transcriptional regulator